jgi:RecA-family ATPase
MSDITDINLFDVEELMGLPAPRWLIKDILPEGDYSVLWGPSGQGKSFVALDWAASLALGTPWQGRHATRQCPVIYIAAEGGRGMQKRVKALMTKHGVHDIPGLYFLVEPLYVRTPGVVEAFLQLLEDVDINPGLVIVDTLSRSFGGGEENASADMGHFLERITQIAKARWMTALIVHHSNATGMRERGHSSLKAGANAMLNCKGVKSEKGVLHGVIVTTDKQKDDIDAEPIYLRAQPMRDSLVLEWEQMPEKVSKATRIEKAQESRKQDMLRILRVSENGYTWEEWRLASGVAKSTFGRRVIQLMKDEEVFKDEHRYYAYPATEDLAALGDDENP